MKTDEAQKDLVRLRRDLHKIPELHFHLPKTRAYLTDYLSNLDCELVDLGEPGFIALFGVSEGKRTIAFRTDMDALAIEETNDIAYISKHKGQMHACGHDGHMAIMLGLSERINANLADLDVGVVLIFQAAEETTGGAKLICQTGVFQRYDISIVYGLHLWPGFPLGTVVCRDGEFMAGTNVINIKIEGRAAHIATYKKGIDALKIACDFVESAYKMEQEELDPSIFRLLKFGMFEAGTGVNIVASSASLGGTLRTYSIEVKEFLLSRLEGIAEEISSRTGAKIGIELSEGYPPVINPTLLYKELNHISKLLGLQTIGLDEPLMVAEDFSYYQKECDGIFFHLGTGADVPLHSSNYDLDDDVLAIGVDIFWSLAKHATVFIDDNQ